MCLAKVIVPQGTEPMEISDVIEVEQVVEGTSVTTLFGDHHTFPGLAIGHVDLQAGVIRLVEESRK